MDAAIARYVTDWSGDKTLHPVDNWCGARVTTSTPTTRLRQLSGLRAHQVKRSRKALVEP
jgi:hypothetical protein